MGEASADTVTIAEAAALLGVHRNTVRNRVKAGRYRAHAVDIDQAPAPWRRRFGGRR